MEAPPCTPPQLPDDHDVRELRFALVCYGGVSLAIYMHGIAKELERLVRASHRFVAGDGSNPFPAGCVEHAYAEALRRRAARDGGVRTRVVVDVVSGTSAGGINGVCLAKAVAQDLEQGPLTDLWLRNAALGKLLLKRPGLPPLAGNRMLGWIRAAFRAMEERPLGTTLMPPGLALDLFVTTTDLHGYPRRIPLAGPPTVESVVNRIPVHFRYLDGAGDFGDDDALGFAARATSSFPGAFPPARIADISDEPTRLHFADRYLPDYGLNGFPAEKTWFADGGILDNYPFRAAVDAIPGKPAATETDRKLLFVEPDPAGRFPPPDGAQPGIRETVWAGLSTLPRRQPIARALDELRDYNEAVRRLAAMEDAVRPAAAAFGKGQLAGGWDAANTAANEHAAASPAYRAYLRLKLVDVVERTSEALCGLLGYPRESQQALFVAAALQRWAARRELYAAGESLSDDQLAFLQTFDLDYKRRRLGFAIRRASALYGEADREPLNRLKRRLYVLLCELRTVLERADVAPAVAAAEAIFAAPQLAGHLEDWSVDAFLDTRMETIDGARDQLAAALDAQLAGFGRRCWDAVVEETSALPERLADDLRAHLAGFPLWDAAVFPARRLAGVVELDEVEVFRVSPLDATRLAPPPPDRFSRALALAGAAARRVLRRPPKRLPAAAAKLRGVAIAHFGGFFLRRWRENDYLWGRLDGAERLLAVLEEDDDAVYASAFRAIAAEERDALTKVRALLRVAAGA
ncbi:MAG TPA: patatin-like protein [Gaiellaceae bacterium]|nr:patatin-like protein [Gaiellaceae bacterium]